MITPYRRADGFLRESARGARRRRRGATRRRLSRRKKAGEPAPVVTPSIDGASRHRAMCALKRPTHAERASGITHPHIFWTNGRRCVAGVPCLRKRFRQRAALASRYHQKPAQCLLRLLRAGSGESANVQNLRRVKRESIPRPIMRVNGSASQLFRSSPVCEGPIIAYQ
jgi:hypothetical protein